MNDLSKIKSILNNNVDKLDKIFEKMNIEDCDIYANWLAQTYYFVSHSTSLLAIAGGLIEDKQIKNRFFKHISEENNHELLAQRDMKNINKALSQFKELSSTSAFYQTQYFQVEHINPISLMGYILLLEQLAIISGTKLYERVCKSHGSKAASFLKVHSEEDIDHVEKALEVVAALDDKDCVLENLSLSADLYLNILNEISSSKIKLDLVA